MPNCLKTGKKSWKIVWLLMGGGFRLPPAVALRDSKEYFTTINHITPLIKALKIPGPERSIDVTARTAISIKECIETGYAKIRGSRFQKGSMRFCTPTHSTGRLHLGQKCRVCFNP